MLSRQSKKKIKQTCSLILAIILMSSCATRGKSVGLGTTLGAGMGAALGGIIDPGKKGQYRTRNVIVGASAGAIAGGFTGSTLFDQKEQEKEIMLLREKSNNEASKPKPPALSEPKVEAHWVESKAVGNRWVEGHYEYVITEPTRWSSP